MKRLGHEKSRIDANPLLRHAGTVPCFGPASPRGLGRAEDCRLVADPGRSAPGLGGSSPGTDPHELEPLGSPRKCSGSVCFKATAQSGPSVAVKPRSRQGFGQGSGKVTPSRGAKSRPVGRTHTRDPFEAPLGNKPEGPTSPVLDAPIGVSAETCQLQLPASSCCGGPPVPAEPKKNFRDWAGMRPWSFKTRRGSVCIPAWVGVGPNADNGSGLQPPVAIMRDSTFPAGWRPCWAGAA